MSMTAAQMASYIKRVAVMISGTAAAKERVERDRQARLDKLQEEIDQRMAKFEEQRKEIGARFDEKLDALQKELDVFEAPIREITGGYSTSDLIYSEKVQTGFKDGKPTFVTKWTFKYPNTIVPPAEADTAPISEMVDDGPEAVGPDTFKADLVEDNPAETPQVDDDDDDDLPPDDAVEAEIEAEIAAEEAEQTEPEGEMQFTSGPTFMQDFQRRMAEARKKEIANDTDDLPFQE